MTFSDAQGCLSNIVGLVFASQISSIADLSLLAVNKHLTNIVVVVDKHLKFMADLIHSKFLANAFFPSSVAFVFLYFFSELSSHFPLASLAYYVCDVAEVMQSSASLINGCELLILLIQTAMD